MSFYLFIFNFLINKNVKIIQLKLKIYKTITFLSVDSIISVKLSTFREGGGGGGI